MEATKLQKLRKIVIQYRLCLAIFEANQDKESSWSGK